MKIFIACFSLILSAASVFAQTERQILVTPNADHPQIAKDSGLGGTVTVYVTVDPAGNVVSVGEVVGPGSICPSVIRADVVALRESARTAALGAKFAPIDSTIPVTIPLNFTFPAVSTTSERNWTPDGQNLTVVGDRDYSASSSPAPDIESAKKSSLKGEKFTANGDPRSTATASERTTYSVFGDPRPGGSTPPPDYTGPVVASGSNSGIPTASGNVPKQISGGVLNGKAMSLPKPPYPPAARAVRASGAVSIQVLIDEDGKIFSAAPVSGHPLLRAAARQAACGAEFSPTTLMGNPVKVSGVITYNFVP